MVVNSKYRNLWNLKAFIIAFQITFIFCFFIGIFSNSLNTAPTIYKNKWFWINRGYPVAWSGVTLPKLSVDFPLIKAPFLTREGDYWAKIIDLKIFLPLFLSVLAVVYTVVYPVTFIFLKAAGENKFFKIILAQVYILLTAACIFSYFFLFRWGP